MFIVVSNSEVLVSNESILTMRWKYDQLEFEDRLWKAGIIWGSIYVDCKFGIVLYMGSEAVLKN